MTNQFEQATRIKLRFESSQGFLATEDLWSLSLASLDAMAKKVAKLMRDEDEESFIPNKDKVSTQNNLRLDILKTVINTKVEENEARKTRTEKLANLERLKALAANKADEQLSAKSLDDIQKMIAELETSV